MLIDRHEKSIVTLSTLAAIMAGAVSTMALIDPCIYVGRMDPALQIGSTGFDAMSLLVSFALFVCLSRIHAGSKRAWLIWSGLQAYLVYAYALYAFGLVYTAMYPFYIAIVGLSVFALARFWRSVDPSVLAVSPMSDGARWGMAAALIAIASIFTTAWAILLIDAIVHGEDLPAGAVIVLDLAFALPLLIVSAAQLLRKRPMGYLMASGAFVLSTAVTIGVAFGELARPMYGGEFVPGAFVLYLAPGIACAVLAWVSYRHSARLLAVPLCKRVSLQEHGGPAEHLIRRNYHAANH